MPPDIATILLSSVNIVSKLRITANNQLATDEYY